MSSQPLTDAEIDAAFVRYAQGGCETSYNLVYRALGDLLRGTTYKAVRCHTDTNDHTQNVWTRVHEKRASFDPELGTFRSWLINISVRMLQNRHRDRGRRRVTPEAEFVMDSDKRATPETPLTRAITTLTPEAEAFGRMGFDKLREIIETVLPPQYRDIAILRYVEGYSNEEAAEMLGMSLGSVRAKSSRAYERICRAFEEWDESA